MTTEHDDDILSEVDRVVPPAKGGAAGRRRRVSADARPDSGEVEKEAESEAPERASDPEPIKPEPIKPGSMPSLDIESILPASTAPRPTETTKTLGDMYAKYSVGTANDFKVQVWRTWPKIHRGVKIDGFYDTWSNPLSEEEIGSEYGGGTYRVCIVGPHPSDPTQQKRYESLTVEISGAPKEGRVPKHQQPAEAVAAPQLGNGMMMMREPENPKLVETAMKVVADVADRERTERRAAEVRADGSMDRAEKLVTPLVDAERRRADEVLAAEREKNEAERRFAEERIREAQARADREIARLQADGQREREADRIALAELKSKMAAMEANDMNRPSAAAEMREILQLPQFQQRGDDGKQAAAAIEIASRSHDKMIETIMAKHSAEMESMRTQHQDLINSIRRSHDDDKSSMRESHTRALEAERESSRTREERVQSLLAAEREERRRDQDRHRETLAERDQSWKDRLETQQTNLEVQWKARLSATEMAFETQKHWQQGEMDRKIAEISELRTKMSDNLDPVVQLQRMKEFREMAQETFGANKPDVAPLAPVSGGGIGGSGNLAEMVKDMIAPVTEGIGDNIPGIISAFMSRGGPAPAPTAPVQPKLGEVFNHPQHGRMVAVQAPDGSLQGVPEAQYAAYQASLAQQQQQGQPLLSGGQQQRGQQRGPSRGQPQPSQEASRRRRRAVSMNFADGLERPAHWDDVEEREPPQQRQQPQQRPTQQQRRPAPAPVPVEQPAAPIAMNPAQKAAAAIIAKQVHQHVVQGDDPEDFVEALTKKYPAAILQQVVATPTEVIVQAIKEAEPNGAGATPAGEAFGRRAIDLLRAAVAG
jgi:hypothetical protein